MTTNSFIDMSDDQRLDYSHQIRHQLIQTIIKDGMPDSTKQQLVLLSALSDLDRSSLGRKRIGVAEQQTAADLLVAKAIASLANQVASNPFESQTQLRAIPEVEVHRLPPANPVPDETAIGLLEGCYEALIKQFD